MHVVIATDGHLDPGRGAEFAARLAGEGGKVTVLSIVEVPRRLLDDLRSVYGRTEEETLIVDHETVNVREVPAVDHSPWPGDDAMIGRYLRDQVSERTDDLVAALRVRGVEPNIEAREGESPAADILAAVKEIEADVLLIGSHGRGLFEGLLGSTGTKLARLAECPVLLIRKRA
jgi:nucleotide-binding universal stress UspA family protein